MIVDYMYCNSCGSEAFDIDISFSRTTADGAWWFCPDCDAEISDVDVDDFRNCNEGYILNGESVEGVYIDNLAATIIDDGSVVVGIREVDCITGHNLSLEEMNRFCFMWLCIFNESVIVKEKDSE